MSAASKTELSGCGSIEQPGPPAPERIQWVEGRGRAFSFTLEAGLPLLEAARRGFAAAGFAGGTLNIKGGALGPFAYVMPALSKTGENAAFYSDIFRPAGVTRLKIGDDDAGRARRRAVLPLPRRCGPKPTAASMAATSCPRRPWSPSPSRSRPSASTARCLRRSRTPRPISSCSGRYRRSQRRGNRPAAPSRCGCGRTRILPARWKHFAAQHGIIRARIHGGVGSTIGARFTDGRSVVPFATELAIRSGTIAPGADGALEAELDIALVDYTGGLAEGRLMRGDNPVLMTMELVLEVVEQSRVGKGALAPSATTIAERGMAARSLCHHGFPHFVRFDFQTANKPQSVILRAGGVSSTVAPRLHR